MSTKLPKSKEELLKSRIYSARYEDELLVWDNPYREQRIHSMYSLVLLFQPHETTLRRRVLEPVTIQLYSPASSRGKTYYAYALLRDHNNEVFAAGSGCDRSPFPLCIGGAVDNAFLEMGVRIVSRARYNKAHLRGEEDVVQCLYAVARSMGFRQAIRKPEYHRILRIPAMEVQP